MDGYIVNGSVGMPRGSLLRIDDGEGVLDYVWEGEIWLTQEGSAEDHLLQAGQWFRVDRGGAAIAHACRHSMVALSSPVPDSPARSIALRRQGAAPVVLHRGGRPHGWHALRKYLAGLFAPSREVNRSGGAPLAL